MEKFNFEQVREQLQQTKRELIILLSNQAQNYFLSSFRKQGFDGEAWEEVQRRDSGINPKTGKGYSAYLYPKGKGLQRRTSPILTGAGWKVRGGTLRRAVSNMAKTAHVYQSSFKMIVDVPYAGYLNEGTPKMPQRQFVGQTAELTQMQEKKIIQIVDRIWKAQPI